ncbi:MAG: hypothetical protein V3T33_05195, partial [Myxococcota bacterium]
LIGAGNRGRFTYGAYARERPERLRVVALAEPEPQRRAVMAATSDARSGSPVAKVSYGASSRMVCWK